MKHYCIDLIGAKNKARSLSKKTGIPHYAVRYGRHAMVVDLVDLIDHLYPRAQGRWAS